MNEEFVFTGIESIIDWMEQTGLLDALTDILVDISVEAIYAFVALAISSIGSLAAGGVILAVLAVVGIVAVISFLITVLVAVLIYVLYAIGLSKIAKKLGVKHRFLAWIPYARIYLLGECAEQSRKRNNKKTWKWSLILLLTSLALGIGQPVLQAVIYIILSVLPMLSVVINVLLECSSVILLVMIGYCLWNIYREFMDNAIAIVLAVICSLGGWIGDVILFIVGFFKLRPASIPEEPCIPVTPVVIPNE